MKRDSAAAEDFLGLGQDEESQAPDLSAEEEDFWSLASPAIDDFDALSDGTADEASDIAPMMSGPNADFESEDDNASYSHLDDSTSLEMPSFLEDVAADEPFDLESGAADESDLTDESLSLDFSDSNDLDGESEEVSWLMEFDVEEEPDFSDTASDLVPATAELEGQDEEQGFAEDMAYAATARSPWIGRILIAVASIAIGIVGSKYLTQQQTPTPVEPRVVQTTPPQQPTQVPPTATTTEPIEVAVAPPSVEPTPTPIEVTPTPVAQTQVNPGGNEVQPVVEPGPATVEVAVKQPTDGVERRTQENPAEQFVKLPIEQDPHLREASVQEMSGMWLGATIPLEALARPDRLLTPNVGRVRIVLAEGEAFEGELYAIGQKKVWIESDLGKMALLDWQIEAIEHIVDAEGGSVLGRDRSKDFAGLKSVRVRTVGGVFYGKLVSQEGNTVTIALSSGARITLEGAKVEMAGKTTSRLVDASGAIKEVEVVQSKSKGKPKK